MPGSDIAGHAFGDPPFGVVKQGLEHAHCEHLGASRPTVHLHQLLNHLGGVRVPINVHRRGHAG
jgi:hypothetical protein